MASVTLPDAAAYAWWMSEGGDTTLVRTHRFQIPIGPRVKITAFRPAGAKFVSMGTAIFRVVGRGRSANVTLRWPTTVRNRVSASDFRRSARTLVVDADVVDLAPGYHAEMQRLMAGRGSLSGMNKFWKIDWEWPFETPGWIGLREISQPVPGCKAALPWLQFHALSCLGKRSPEACTEGEWLSVVGIAIGGAGYLDGYDHEEVDDTTPLWSSHGTGNDCDDFAMAAAAVVNFVLLDTEPPTCALERWIREHVEDVYVVSGMAWPRNATVTTHGRARKNTFAHMWCELQVRGAAEPLVIECTSAVAYYGGTPTASNARTGCASGAMSEYLSRCYHWYGDRAYIITGGCRELLPVPAMPEWMTALRYAPPSVSMASGYVHPGTPPLPQPVTAFANTRHHDSAASLTRVLFPFRVGSVFWSFDGSADIRECLDGAY